MKAIWYEQYGNARDVLKYGEIETPVPKSDEIRVSVEVSGLNPSDIKRRRAVSAANPNFPKVIPHMDGSGIIDAVGSNVSNFRKGDRVWLYEAQFGRAFGTAAEYVVLPEHQAVKLPEGISFEAGASLGVPAMTAHRCLFLDGPIKGKTILVQGGAGAVGKYAIELAKWGSAGNVIATVSSEEKANVAREAGADHVVNYKAENSVEKIRGLATEGVDLVVEVSFGSNWATDAAVLKENGIISAYSSDSQREPKISFPALMGKNLTVHFILVYLMPKEAHKDAIRAIQDALGKQYLEPTIARRFPLSSTIDAHEFLESGKALGKILIDVAQKEN